MCAVHSAAGFCHVVSRSTPEKNFEQEATDVAEAHRDGMPY
jgi:hypothetical protein